MDLLMGLLAGGFVCWLLAFIITWGNHPPKSPHPFPWKVWLFWLGILVIIAVCLCPPWVSLHTEKDFDGRRWIVREEWRSDDHRWVGSDDWAQTRKVDFPRLALELCIPIVAVGGLFLSGLITRKGKSKTDGA